MPIGEQTYIRVALEDTDETWELIDGWLRAKPGASITHNDVACFLGFSFQDQLDRAVFRGRINGSRLRSSPRDYYVLDVCIVPQALSWPLRGRPDMLEVYDDPMPLVAEVWEPPTADYDARRKPAGYQRRGDREIWWLHPYERALTAWRRQPDGSYVETTQTGGTARPVALPNVTVDLDALFAG